MLDYTAFDIEITNDLPDDERLRDYSILGVACAAAAYRDVNSQIIYRTWIADGLSMTRSEVAVLVANLQQMRQQGQLLVTVNGAGFDFQVLAASSELYKECAELALAHVDLSFMMLAQRGYFLSLEAMARGAAVRGKLKEVRLLDGTLLKNMSGEKAPGMWRAGEREAVLAYLRDDVRATLETCEIVAKKKGIGWTARSGRWNWQRFNRPLTVAQCLDLPLPDTSWMDRPLTRDKVLRWIAEEL